MLIFYHLNGAYVNAKSSHIFPEDVIKNLHYIQEYIFDKITSKNIYLIKRLCSTNKTCSCEKVIKPRVYPVSHPCEVATLLTCTNKVPHIKISHKTNDTLAQAFLL